MAEEGVGCETEAERVDRWRWNRFLELRFDGEQAGLLSDGGADVYLVAAALEHGCSHELALRIFL